mgnify:CR=1 FL=1
MFARLRPHMLLEERGAIPEAPRYTCDKLGTGIQALPSKVTVTEDGGPSFFRPGGQDPLFWCFQIARGESNDLEPREDRSFQREQALKADAVLRLREVTPAKTMGAQRKLADAEAELCGRRFTRGLGLQALAAAYALPVLYVSGRTCCAMGPAVDDNAYAAVIRRVGTRNSRRHEVLVGPEVSPEAAKTVESVWCVESWVKPLRGVSTYSLGELQGMVGKAGLRTHDPAGKRLKKADLHAALGALAQQN